MKKKKVKPVSDSKGNTQDTKGKTEVFCRYITRKGKRIYHPTGGVFHFFI